MESQALQSKTCLAIGAKAQEASKDAKIAMLLREGRFSHAPKDAKIAMLLREGRFSHAPKSTLRSDCVTAVQTPLSLATAPQGCTLSGFLS